VLGREGENDLSHRALAAPVAAAIALALAAPMAGASARHATALGAVALGVRVVTVATLNDPVGFTFTPQGRIVYLERDTGRLRSLNPATGRDRVLFTIRGVNSEGERGALGVALHPDWPRQPFVYVYVTRRPRSAPLRNQLVRIRIAHGHGTGMNVLLQSPIGGRSNHNGGRIAFGPDGKLYVVIGDGGEDMSTAQDLTAEPRGKVLRLNANGSVPAHNPFPTSPIWSFGHRNSIGFAFDPETGNLWESENGPDCNDEINLIQRGGNFGWGPSEACPDTNQDGPLPRLAPIWNFDETVAATGVAFCDRCGLGAAYDGDLFMGCANGNCKMTVGPIAHAGLNGPRDDFAGPPQHVRLRGFAGPVYSIEVGPGRRIYFSNADAIYRLAPA
jgi:aldose sugar dehydrogenase